MHGQSKGLDKGHLQGRSGCNRIVNKEQGLSQGTRNGKMLSLAIVKEPQGCGNSQWNEHEDYKKADT
jgi:hypothetical protein